MNFNNKKIMVISDASWRDDNNIGNTFNDIFQNHPKEDIAFIYGRPDLPSTTKCDIFFQFSEVRMIRKIFNKNVKVGMVVNNDFNVTENDDVKKGNKIYKIFRKTRLNIFLIARELLWRTFSVQNKEMYDFIDKFNPDIIFNLATPGIYMNKIQQEIIRYSKKESYIYFVDDLYSLKQFSISPFYWIRRLFQIQAIKKTVLSSSKIYVISELMKKEYDQLLNRETSILAKTGRFTINHNNYENIDMKSIKFVYTGNLIYGRFKVIYEIAKALKEINEENKTNHYLDIYSATELSRRQIHILKSNSYVNFKGKVSSSNAIKAQYNGDILIHVESFELRNKLTTRLSFSTKIVDYFQTGKCMFAVGPKINGSLQYLEKNNAAIVSYDKNDIKYKLLDLVLDKNLITHIGKNAFDLGYKNHNIRS